MAGIATAVAGTEGLLPMQRALLEALAPALTGYRVQLDATPTMTAADLAKALERRSPEFRTRIVQIMVLAALLRHPIPDDVASGLAAYEQALGVEEGMIDVARDLAAGSADLAARDFERNGYVEREGLGRRDTLVQRAPSGLGVLRVGCRARSPLGGA